MTDNNSQDYPAAPEGSVRLNKFLASCGYESRRAADRLIAEGRVEVNGKAVDTPGLRVLPTDFVKVDGHHATPKDEVVLLLNKPRGYVCSRDAQGAVGTVYDLLPPKYRYANYVGRLDADSEGLLIFTNNGSLGQSIGHPSGGIEKEYWVTLDQAFDNTVLIQLLKGVRIPEGQAKAKYVSRLSARRACVVLEQGLKRQVRQMFACLGLRVRKLVRVRIGSLWGGDLEPGGAELLTPEQVKLATVNPRRRKGLIGAQQAFRPRHTESAAPSMEEDEDVHYEFNPADFETEEEALESATRYHEGESFEPEREDQRRPFGRAPRDKRDFGERRSFGGDRERWENARRGFGERRSFDRERRDNARQGFGERREGGRPGFGDRERRDNARQGFGERREGGRPGFGGRERRDNARQGFGERREGGRPGFGGRERRENARQGFGERREGGRPGFGGRERRDNARQGFGERREGGRPGFGGRERRDNARQGFGERREGGRPGFGERRGNGRSSFSARNERGRRPYGGDRGNRRFGRDDA